MSTTKADIINGSFSLLRISGITVNPSGEDLTLAVGRLEDMAAEFAGRNIHVNYNFEENPLLASLHNLQRKHHFAFKANLAVRLAPDFGKQIPPALVTMQQSSFSFLSADTAPIKETPYPTRMPRGSANTRRSMMWRRFYVPEAQAPLAGGSITMYINDIKAFSESFIAYLDAGETITAFAITADTGLTITTSTNATPLITYVIQADGLSSGGSIGLLQVKIVVTTSAGRIETRIVDFQLLQSDVID